MVSNGRYMLTNWTFALLRSALCLVLFLGSTVMAQQTWGRTQNSMRLYVETDLPDSDSSRFTIDFGELSFGEVGLLPQRLGDHADLLKSPHPLAVNVFVPATLDPELRQNFMNSVQAELVRHNPQVRIVVKLVELDVERAARDQSTANQRIDSAVAEMERQNVPAQVAANELKQSNTQVLEDLRVWEKEFPADAQKYTDYVRGGYTKDKDERVGGWIGYTRGMVSAAVWFGFNKVSWSTAFQIPASFFLDWFFSKYERKVDIFKGTHRLPGSSIPILGYAIRFYNDSPALKSWLVGYAIGLAANSYFRFWSHVEDPVRTSAPWSAEAFAAYNGAVGIGSLAGAYGAQAPRILRKKGYISSRMEYYIYVSYGIAFQASGFLYGLGWDRAFMAFNVVEGAAKVGAFAYGYTRPFKEARAIVMHPALSEKESTEILYRMGLEQSETHSPERTNFAEIVKGLKAEQNVKWKERVRRKFKNAYDSCSSLLRVLSSK